MDVRVEGKVFIVTGAAQGIGLAIAHRVATSGAAGVLLTDRQPLDTATAELKDGGGEITTLEADLEADDAPDRIAAAALERFGRLDGLVNAAAITDRGGVERADAALYDRLYRINQRAPTLLMAQAIPHLRAAGGGAIVNILTMNIHGGSPPLALYASTKAALALITRNAAHAHRFDHIRINGIAAGWVDSPGERRLQAATYGRGEDYFAARAAEQPLGRLMTPDDVARLALFLLSDASIPTTGAIIDNEQSVVGVRDWNVRDA